MYVLTAVTATFLPLSFVSSIFGMKITDIRLTERHQWVFWATAVPITILILGLSLLVVRYLESAREALSMVWDSRKPGTRDIIGPPSQQQRYSHQRQVDHNTAAPGPVLRPQENIVPTYIKVHRKWLSPSTLDVYELPWEWEDVGIFSLTS